MSKATYRDRNSLEIFSRHEIAQPFQQLVRVIMGPGEISAELKGEVFTVASLSSGCRHCQAHGAYGLHLGGTSDARIQALWDFERSTHFTEADRAALRLARDAGSVPNAVSAQHYEDLRRHFTDRQIQEVLAVIALTGFLNRYSDTLAVVTDQESVDWATNVLAPLGWQLGKHAGSQSEQRTEAPFSGTPFESLIPSSGGA
ncbi:MAG: carboxymuconolactone decarboxylase family protein [Proteobacteria bacterium]|nr:carboxymuconolactone decarboxylase family protein [Pseudomonadota bacterium]